MNKKEAKIIALLIIILIIAIVIVFANYLSLEKGEKKADNTKSTTKLVVDKKEVVSDNILKHETIKTGENYSKANEDDRNLYEITNLKKESHDQYTLIKGKLKNKDGKANIVIKLECLDEKNNIVSSSSIEIKDLKKGSTKDFEIKMMNTVFTDNYNVVIDFVGDK